MRILLIVPPLMDVQNGALSPISMDAVRTCPSYGIYLLAAVLRQKGHEVIIVDLIAQGSKELIHHAGLIMSSHLVGITASSLAWPTAKACIAEIRTYHPRIPIVVGGIHATMFDYYILGTTFADYCIRGEGEIALPMLCEALAGKADIGSVGNLSFKLPNGRIRRNPALPPMRQEQLGALPLPDYRCIHPGIYTGLGIESSRGCLFDCIFCATSYRKTWRCLDPVTFTDRAEAIVAYCSLTTRGLLQIIDDEFSLDLKRATAIFKEFAKRNVHAKVVFDSRANDLLDEEYLEAAKPYAHQFLVGAECGYDRGLKKIGKGTTTDKLTRAAELLSRYEMAERADFSFIMGLPWESQDDVLKTVEFALGLFESYGVRILLQWYCQIPGSRLWDEQRKKEIVHESLYDDFGFFRNDYLFRTGVRLTPSEIYQVQARIDHA
ncbi:MAG: B12-binding domain-containing radical SAM protein, partial [Desulfatitalea sp.]|nr:B12-binding domain-containing radical SAM protein [Desulfatitalea sp.]